MSGLGLAERFTAEGLGFGLLGLVDRILAGYRMVMCFEPAIVLVLASHLDSSVAAKE